MTNLQKDLIVKTIPIYCKAKGISLQELAVKAGVGYKDVIRKMADGKGSDLPAKLWRQVWNVINPDAMEGLHSTADFKKVFAACENARMKRRMIGLTGDTGMGKSTSLKAYAIRPNVWYFYIDPTISPRTFMYGLLREMGIPFEGSLYEMQHRVSEELNTRETPLLIIDEAGKLSHKMTLCLHSLRDATMGNCGIVLAGMPQFKNQLISNVNKGKNGYSEFYRRINLWDELTGLTAAEITQVLEANGITDKEEQKDFRRRNRFGDLMNEITLYKEVQE